MLERDFLTIFTTSVDFCGVLIIDYSGLEMVSAPAVSSSNLISGEEKLFSQSVMTERIIKSRRSFVELITFTLLSATGIK